MPYLLFLFLIKIFLGSEASAQLFIPLIGCRSEIVSDGTQSTEQVQQGTFSNTVSSGTSIYLSIGVTSGTYTSKVFDIFGGCSPLMPWLKFEWKSDLPYYKELPSSSESLLDYPLVSPSLQTSLVQLFGLNGSGAIASGTAITAAVGVNGTALNGNASGMSYVTGKLNRGISFDGTDDQITLPYTQTNANDYSISTWFKTSTTGNGVFVQDRGTGAGKSLTLGIGTNPGGCGTGRISYGVDSNAIYIGLCTTATYHDNNWHHVAGVWDGTSGTAVASSQFTIYVDGASVSTTNVTVGSTNAPVSGLSNTKFGRHDTWGVYYNGSLDETGIWTKPLTAAEVLQLYRRGANRVSFQFKSCNFSDCSDSTTWMGPDGTSATSFSEINNNTIQDTGFGNVVSASPVMTFSNFPSFNLANNRYFQYRAVLETDKTAYSPDFNFAKQSRGCGGGSITYTTSGTWTLPAGCSSFTVTVNGAGGGSARMVSGTKKAGGNGGQAVKTFTNQTPLTVYTVTIGSGGQCAQTAGGGAYNGGAGGNASTCTVGSAGAGGGTGGTGGTKVGAGCNGGAGGYGGGGGGGGAGGGMLGAGGGGASAFILSGTNLVVAGGGAGSGSSDQGAGGNAGNACVNSSGYGGENGGNGTGGDTGGGGGGGGCFCSGGTCNANPTSAGGAGGTNTGTTCVAANNGTNGSISIVWP